MLFLLSVLLLVDQSVSDPVAHFTGHSLISYYASIEQDSPTVKLTFKTDFAYGNLISVGNYNELVYRVSIFNSTLMVNTSSEEGYTSLNLCSDCFKISQWNTLTIALIPKNSVSVEINSISFPLPITNIDHSSDVAVHLGGLPSSDSHQYHQFYGYFKYISIFGHAILSEYSDNTTLPNRILVSNVDIIPETEVNEDYHDTHQTVTVNSSDIKFPLLQSSFKNFSLSFEFKSPENVLLFLSFQMKQFFFSLRKDYKQLILEFNLHGDTDPLIVELTSVTEWTRVDVLISDELSILSASNQKNEVKTRSTITHRRFERRPIFFGFSESIGYGFRGCLRNFVLNGQTFPLYTSVVSHPGTLVGCHFPSPSCDTMSCPFSCTQTWDETKCVNADALPSTAEFEGLGIIQINIPSLISTGDDTLVIKTTFVSRSSKAGVLLNLQHTEQDVKSVVMIQMIEGFIMLTLSLETTNVALNTDLPLNDGEEHLLTVVVRGNEISLQVDTRIKRQSETVDIAQFNQTTSVKIGGSSLKLNNYGFAGCLSDISINGLDLLALATNSESTGTVFQEVLLGQCSLITDEEYTDPFRDHHTPVNLQSTTPSTIQSDKTGYNIENGSTDGPPSKQNSKTDPIIRNEPRKEEQQLLIGLMLGFVTLLAVLIFLAYFLWQRRQMNQAAKERQRKSSDDPSLDEEFLMKTYNPCKQDKFTHFTPNALEAIEEESESLEQSSLTSFTL